MEETTEALTKGFGKEKGEEVSSIFMDDLLAEGVVIGRKEGIKKGILKTLEIRFGSIPEEIRNKISPIRDETVLDSLFIQAHKCTDINDFHKELN